MTLAESNESRRFQRVREVFEAALDLDGSERQEFVRRECADEDSIRREVEQLLSCDADEGTLSSLLDRGADLLAAGVTAGVAAGKQLFPGKTMLMRARALAFAGMSGEAKATAQKAVTLLEPAVKPDDDLLLEAKKLAN